MDNKFRLIFGVILVGLILSYIAWDNAKKNRKLERHYAEYPKIDKSLSFNGRIVSIFGDWEAMKVHEMSMDVSIKLDSESISMSATSDGTFTGEGIGHFISIGDSIYKEVSNDTVWVKKAYSKDLLPFVLVRNGKLGKSIKAVLSSAILYLNAMIFQYSTPGIFYMVVFVFISQVVTGIIAFSTLYYMHSVLVCSGFKAQNSKKLLILNLILFRSFLASMDNRVEKSKYKVVYSFCIIALVLFAVLSVLHLVLLTI